jgi:hypothetical protein
MMDGLPPIPPLIGPPDNQRLGRRLWRAWQRVWPVLRQVLGWFFIALGIVGLVLPVLQGVLFLMIGIALVGRRNWLIRWVSVHTKLLLRRWADHPHPVLGWPGRWSLRAQQRLSRQRRKMAMRWMERRALERGAGSAGTENAGAGSAGAESGDR